MIQYLYYIKFKVTENIITIRIYTRDINKRIKSRKDR